MRAVHVLVLRTACTVTIYAGISGTAAWYAADLFSRYLYIDPYAAILFYHPLLWLAGFLLLFMATRERFIPLLKGWRGYLFALTCFGLAYLGFFLFFLSTI